MERRGAHELLKEHVEWIKNGCLPADTSKGDGKSNHDSASSTNGCSHDKMPPTSVKLDEKGDTIMIVGREKCCNRTCTKSQGIKCNRTCFHVDSATFERASVSSAFPTRSYASPGSLAHVKHVILLSEEDPETMRIILDIIYKRYPQKAADVHLPLEKLFNLTVTAKKFKIVHLFKDWADHWIVDMKKYYDSMKFVASGQWERLLWIFYVLGHQPLYCLMILQIALNTGIDHSGQLIDPRAQFCFDNNSESIPVPPMAPTEVAHMRMEFLKLIRKPLDETLEKHLRGDEYRTVYCERKDGIDDSSWRRAVLNAVSLALEDTGLWPLPTVHNMHTSPQALLHFLRINPNLPAFVHLGDESCLPTGSFWLFIINLVRAVPCAITEDSFKSLNEQAAVTGLDEYLRPEGLGLDPEARNWSLDTIREFQMGMKTFGRTTEDVFPDWVAKKK